MLDTSCRWVQTQLPLWIGGDLIGADRRRVERHVLACSACRARREELAKSQRLIGVLANTPIAKASHLPSLWNALACQIQESRHPVASSTPWWRVFVWPVTGITSAALLVTGMMLSQPSTNRLAPSNDEVIAKRSALPGSSSGDPTTNPPSSTKIADDAETLSSSASPIPASSLVPQPSS